MPLTLFYPLIHIIALAFVGVAVVEVVYITYAPPSNATAEVAEPPSLEEPALLGFPVTFAHATLPAEPEQFPVTLPVRGPLNFLAETVPSGYIFKFKSLL